MSDEFCIQHEGKPFPLILVADRTLFHDMFRKSYGTNVHAEWLLGYLTWRRGLAAGQILVTASSTLEQVRSEFKELARGTGREPLPRVLAAVYSFTRLVDLQTAVPSKHAPLYVAALQAVGGVIPIIVTSVSSDTIRERIHDAGLKMNLPGFTTTMSRLRIERGAWFASGGAAQVAQILAECDPCFQRVIAKVGLPPTGSAPATS
jgi:hypothetical protein